MFLVFVVSVLGVIFLFNLHEFNAMQCDVLGMACVLI